MSFALIEEAIKKIPNATWSLYLVEYNHKRRPNEYVCYDLHLNSEDFLLELISDISKEFLKNVQKCENIADYTDANSKNSVDKLSVVNELINDNWSSLIDHINNSDDSADINTVKSSAYVFVGSYKNGSEEENIYLINRKNPIVNCKKKLMYTCKSNTIKEINKPLIQFSKSFDMLVHKNVLYTINRNFETIFNIEYSYKKICKKCLDKIKDSELIDDYNSYESFASSAHYPKKFITYDNSVIECLKEQQWRVKISQKFNIPINTATGKFELSDADNAKKFTLLVCNKTKLNIFDSGVCEVPSSIPLPV